MKNFSWIRTLAVLVLLSASGPGVKAADTDGVALAIVYDTSGSMGESVRDASGSFSPKYRIANRALEAITKQIQAYAAKTAEGAARSIQAGLITFDGNGTRQAVPFGTFDAAAMLGFARKFSEPRDGTPLGKALEAASQAVMTASPSRKHVLVITDGMNTLGPDPAQVYPGILRRAEQKQTAVLVHFVAFDVDAKVFAPLKKLGVNILAASDEKQLNSQLEFIMQRKILLEDEEPPKKN